MSQLRTISGPGLASKIKDRLIQQALERRAQSIDEDDLRRTSPLANQPPAARSTSNIPDAWTRFDEHPGYQRYKLIRDGARKIGIANPFFQVQDGVSSATARVDNNELLNFSGYN